MFLSKELCYVELEKTAVNYIRETYLKNIKNGVITGAHDFIDENIISDKPLFVGSIRNPYDWYISRWSYGCMREHNDSLFRNLIKKRLRFSRNREVNTNNIKKIKFFINQIIKSTNYWKKLYSNPRSAENFRTWLKSLLKNNKKKDLAEHYFFSNLFNNFGYLTYRYLIMFTLPKKRDEIFNNNEQNYDGLLKFDSENNFIDQFIKFENLNEGLEISLNKIGIEFKDQLNKLNKSERISDIDYYYDKETKDMVKNFDRFIFEKHDYN